MKLFTFEPVYDSGDPTGGTDTPPPTETTPPQPTVSWEERYKGLQAASEKKSKTLEKELQDAKTKLEKALEDLETARSSGTQASSTADQLTKDLQALKTQVDALSAEKSQLATKISRQNIVISEFPNLLPLIDYIPGSDTDEGFREAAKKFSETFEDMFKQRTDQLVNTSTKPPPSVKNPPSQAEVDRIWDVIYATAGISGKEKEYNEARLKLQGILGPQI